MQTLTKPKTAPPYQRTQRRRVYGATKLEAFQRAEKWLMCQPKGYGVSYPSGHYTERGYCLTVELLRLTAPETPTRYGYVGQYVTGHLSYTGDLRDGLPLKGGA